MGQVASTTSISPLTTVLGLFSSLVLYGIYKALSIVFRRTALRNIPGPGKGHLIYGNMQSILASGPSEQHARWEKEYGHVYVYNTFLNACLIDFMFVIAIELNYARCLGC
jgi:hypothetical protein